MTRPANLDEILSFGVVKKQGDERFRNRLIDLMTYWTIYQDEIFLFTTCPYFVDHGMPHSQNVTRIFGNLVEHLSPEHALNDCELFLGACACYLHDVGMFDPQTRAADETRRMHGALSRERIERQKEQFMLCGDEPRMIGLLAAFHQSKMDLETLPSHSAYVDFWQREWRPRLRLLAALLSLADACDMGTERFSGIKAVRDQYLEGWRLQRDNRLAQLEKGAPEAYPDEAAALRREIANLTSVTPAHYDIHRAVRRVHIERSGGLCDILIEPVTLQTDALNEDGRALLSRAQEMIHGELERSKNVLQVVLPFFSSVRVGHPDIAPLSLERRLRCHDGYREAPGMRQIYRHIKLQQANGKAPDALIGVSNGGMLAASLLSRWTNIPLGTVVRPNPRSQTLTYGRDVQQSQVVATTDLRELASALGRERLHLALVEDVCRTGTSVLMAGRGLLSSDARDGAHPIVEEFEALTLVAGEAVGHLDHLVLAGEGADDVRIPLYAGEKERDTTIVMPWETELTATRLGLDAAASLLGALEQHFAAGRRPAVFIAASNGGAILASHLAPYFNIPAACFTRSNPGRQWLGGGQAPQESSVIAGPDLAASGFGEGDGGSVRVMLVDDIARSGRTLLAAIGEIKRRNPDVDVDACLLYAGKGTVGDDLEAYRARLRDAGCEAFLWGGIEPALGTRLPWDIRPDGA